MGGRGIAAPGITAASAPRKALPLRLAILSDLHANRHALQAVWDDIEAQRPERVYCLGDLVGYGAFPNEVVDFIRSRDIPTIMGNYDEGVGFDLDDCGCACRTAEERARGDVSRLWSQAHTSPENKTYLQGLPKQIRLEESKPTLLLVHGSPRKINEYLFEDRPVATFDRLAALAGADLVLFGHTHKPYQKRVGGTLFVNVGSVGKPHDGDRRACYALLDLGQGARVDLRRVTYDVTAAAEAVRQAGLPFEFADILENGGPPIAGDEPR
jgi:putative phosphoesterase